MLAAGNDGVDACGSSPARVASGITVGASDRNDARSIFVRGSSNYGSCLDIFAPGSDITSAIHTGPSAIGTMSGTSMASPHVAGVAALYLQANPTASPAAVKSAIVNGGTKNAVSNVGPGSPNVLLYSLLTDGAPDPDPDPDPYPDPDPGQCEAPAWSAGNVYLQGDVVSYDGKIWRAKWWTSGEEPGSTGQWGVWEEIDTCDPGAPDPDPNPDPDPDPDPQPDPDPDPNLPECDGVEAWSSTKAYVPGDQVGHGDSIWESTWWSTDVEPGGPFSYAVWTNLGEC